MKQIIKMALYSLIIILIISCSKDLYQEGEGKKIESKISLTTLDNLPFLKTN